MEVACKQAPKVAGQALYISSVTDPYLPAERSLHLTRGILEALEKIYRAKALVKELSRPRQKANK